MPPISVIIAHRKKATRAACLRLLRREKHIRVIGEARSGLEAIAAARLKPRVFLLDVSFSLGPDVAILPVLRRKSPRTKVILLVRRPSRARILGALSHGARGYLEEHALHVFLAKAVRAVNAGEAWVSRKVVAAILDHLARLSLREAGRPPAIEPRSNRRPKAKPSIMKERPSGFAFETQ